MFFIDSQDNICDENNQIFQLNLDQPFCRFKLVSSMFCLAHIFNLISVQNAPKPTFFELFIIKKRANGCTIQYSCDNSVVKEIQLKKEHYNISHTTVEKYKSNLKIFYEQYLKTNKIVNTVKYKAFKSYKNKIIIQTMPICDNDVFYKIDNFENLKYLFKCLFQSLESFHRYNFAHYDVRWPNVVYDAKNKKYLLIDYENLRICESCSENKHDCDKKKDLNDVCSMIEVFIEKRIYDWLEDKEIEFLNNFTDILKKNNKIDKAIFDFLEKD